MIRYPHIVLLLFHDILEEKQTNKQTNKTKQNMMYFNIRFTKGREKFKWWAFLTYNTKISKILKTVKKIELGSLNVLVIFQSNGLFS